MLLGAGGNYVSGGTVTLGAANQINDTATVQLSSGHYSGSSIFSMNGFNETLGGTTFATRQWVIGDLPQRRGDRRHGDARGSGT